MLGLESDIVRLIPYTNEWARLFQEEKSHLLAAVVEYVLDIQHVGSTSIPGMIAKPIIDIAIAVKNFEEASVYRANRRLRLRIQGGVRYSAKTLLHERQSQDSPYPHERDKQS